MKNIGTEIYNLSGKTARYDLHIHERCSSKLERNLRKQFDAYADAENPVGADLLTDLFTRKVSDLRLVFAILLIRSLYKSSFV